jgi:hypothetical protein
MLRALLLLVAVRGLLRHGTGRQREGALRKPEERRRRAEEGTLEDLALSPDEPVQQLFDHIDQKIKALPRTRPLPDCSAHDCSHRIRVNIGLTLLKILAVDQYKGSLKTVVWLKMTWTDYRLFYNASTLHGFKWDSDQDFIPIEATDIWRPDVELLNQAAMMQQSETPGDGKPRAYLYDSEKARSAGYNVMLSIPTILESKCDLDIRSFPFDKQTCPLEFGTWSASDRFIAFDTMDTTETVQTKLPEHNEEFAVKNIDVRTSDFSFKLTEGTKFPTVVYKVTLQRYPRYYIVNYILPLATLVVLSTMTFWLDLRGGERQGFQITLLLSVFAVAYLAAEKLPESPRDTWIEEYQSWCLILAVVPAVQSGVLDSVDKFSGRKGPPPELADGICRVLHPSAILLVMGVMFLGNSDVRNNWSYERAVIPLASLLVVVTVLSVVCAVWRFWKVDLPVIRRASPQDALRRLSSAVIETTPDSARSPDIPGTRPS